MSDGTLSALSKFLRPSLPGQALGSNDILGDKNISPARKFRMMRQQQAEKLIQQDDIKSKLAQAAAGLLKQTKSEME